MRKKYLLYIGLATCLASLSVAIYQGVNPKQSFLTKSTQTEYTLTLNSSNTPSGLTSSYQNKFSGTVKTALNNNLLMSFVNAKTYSGGFVELANHGKIFNFSTSNSKVMSVTGVKFTGTGDFVFKPGVAMSGDGMILADITPISVSAGSSKVTVPACDYFEIEAGDSGAKITSLELSYYCDPNITDNKMLNGTYTGTGSDSYVYKLTISNSSCTFESLNKQTNVSYTGSASLLSRTQAKLVLSVGGNSVDYVLGYDGHQLSFVSKTSSDITQVSFTRVYKVEDFESYASSGQGYTNSTTKYQTTQMRAKYYADYSTSGTGEIGGSGWPVMTSTDNTNLGSGLGRNGTKAGIFKFSNGLGMRYISVNELYGVNSIAGKGSTFSIWMRGGFTNSSFNAGYKKNITVKVFAFYETGLNSSTVASARTETTYEIEAGNTWQHIEMALDSSKNYYGFGLYSTQSTGATTYVAFDDIEIYTVSPHSIYEGTYPAGTYKGTATINVGISVSVDVVISVGTRHNHLIAVVVSNAVATIGTFTYNNANNTFTVETVGDVVIKTSTGKEYSVEVGTLSCTYNSSYNRITINSVTGDQVKDSIKNLNLSKASGTTYYECNDTTSQLQSKFKRRYDSGGGWQNDTSNSDRFTRNEKVFVSGTGAVKMRGFDGGRVALSLNSDFSRTQLKNIHFWVYNPTSNDITLRMWVYPSANYGSNAEIGSVTAKANGWSYCAMGYGAQYLYNFQIADFNNSGIYFTFDNIYLFKQFDR